MAKIDRREFAKYVSITAAGLSLLGTKAFAGEGKLIGIEEAMTMKSNAERNPNSLRARLWRWHTTWCPGWKAYQRELAEKGIPQAS